MKKVIILSMILLWTVGGYACADVIQSITDTDNPQITYPVRDNALVLIFQPVPDNSGDYTITICNKQSRCMQTSMLYNEIRYLGLFLEDLNSIVSVSLHDKLTPQQWLKRQDDFRKLYADYMNMYDKNIGAPEVMTPEGIQIKATRKVW